MDTLDIANKFRSEHGFTGGVVVFFKGIANGWVNELRDPNHWQPGCVASDVMGNLWVAEGGDAQNGAKRWVPVVSL